MEELNTIDDIELREIGCTRFLKKSTAARLREEMEREDYGKYLSINKRA